MTGQKQPAPALLRLKCGANNYAWGKPGCESTVAKFEAASQPADFTIDNNKMYSELWMGTHPTLPASDFHSGKQLVDIINSDDNAAKMLGSDNLERYGSKLPFLFKVLSIGKALSIQAHPNKRLAEKLHAADPANYPDDNHKPEMAIALTEFEGLCGFRPLSQIKHFIQSVPPFRSLLSPDAVDQFVDDQKQDAPVVESKKLLRALFTSLMKSTEQQITDAATALVDGITAGSIDLAGTEGGGIDLGPLVLRLNGQYPNDVGLFNLFFLNYVQMQPGEAMFLREDDIHAYLSGDIIECMASSDNVVRAGFTPKFKDVDTLTSMLTYNYAPIEEQKMEPTEWPFATFNAAAYSSGSESLLYNPPIPEFAVIQTSLRATDRPGRATATVRLNPIDGPSVVVCTSGSGSISSGSTEFAVEQGHVFFVSAGADCLFSRPVQEAGDDFVTYRAFCVSSLSEGTGVGASVL